MINQQSVGRFRRLLFKTIFLQTKRKLHKRIKLSNKNWDGCECYIFLSSSYLLARRSSGYLFIFRRNFASKMQKLKKEKKKGKKSYKYDVMYINTKKQSTSSLWEDFIPEIYIFACKRVYRHWKDVKFSLKKKKERKKRTYFISRDSPQRRIYLSEITTDNESRRKIDFLENKWCH